MSTGGFAGRVTVIDPGQIETLHYLGNYVRRMPTNLPRMMENAYDWEHLPFVHPQAFSSIAIVEEGRWGWRAEVELPAASGGGKQLIELLVDPEQAYWATTVVEGMGQGTQIHTQAIAVSGDVPSKGHGTSPSAANEAIEVDVRFYLPQAPATDEQSAMILGYLQTQYAGLYDQDEALMIARQLALDTMTAPDGAKTVQSATLGSEAELAKDGVHRVSLAGTEYAVRHHEGEWIAHAAVCPHLLGPLGDALIEDGMLTCPWHGYRFPVAGGKEAGGKPCTLPAAALVSNVDGIITIFAPRNSAA